MKKQSILILFPEAGVLWVVLYFSENVRERLNRYEPEAWRSVLAVSEKAIRNVS